nr:immunoglobulin heavy chain junction region [Macaca mulatta]MOX59148.1 immunoglobulin heavy chain junction region [Macaca mulatta]MOX59307.1 immunoglobulin heavy chain junction region [Macaca mulatta]MOX60681.1 immunoglobulin heavy chain junction region [Macaca mulatta]MOX61249.1 immunoglobulin heavy chain junction region [Macaca mulatta]
CARYSYGSNYFFGFFDYW